MVKHSKVTNRRNTEGKALVLIINGEVVFKVAVIQREKKDKTNNLLEFCVNQ